MRKTAMSVLIVLAYVQVTLATITPTKLKCEYLENPMVVDVQNPRLGWVNIATEDERGQKQTAWQIRVASSKEGLVTPDLWDSKKIMSSQSTRIKYKGKALQSEQDCWWQVRVWDKNGTVSDWSYPAFWHMGLLDKADWHATWIGAPWQGEKPLPKPMNPSAALPEQLPPPAPMLRKEFEVLKPIEKAYIYVTGLGYFECYLNGDKIGNDVLVPNQTNYGKRPALTEQYIPLPDDFKEYKVMYLSYDITSSVKQGLNAVGSLLGNGFYNPAKYWAQGYGTPRFIAQIHLTYQDGTEEIIVSDTSWKVAESPIRMDMVYYGEHYDAREEQSGWCTPGFDDAAWENAVVREAPYGDLVAHTAHPDKVVEQLKPIRIEKIYDGRYTVDFGVEVSGWVRLSNIKGPEGHKIEIKYLGNLYSGDNSYVFSGKGSENYAARFNWFVFREVEIINWPGVLTPEQITAEVVNTYIEETADFKTSNQRFNDINTIWKRSQTDNMHGGIASDCPHRERSAYTGDGQVACVNVMHNFGARNFYHKWIHDIIGAQVVETGYVPNGAPWQPGCGGGVAWGAAISIMPWEYYVHYGSVDILEDSYEPMKEYIRYMKTWVDEEGIMFSQREGKDGNVLKWFNLGEWVTPGTLPPDELVHTFYYWRCLDFTAKTAKVLGKKKEAKLYAAWAENTRQAFTKRFYNQETGSYGNAGANIFALKMGVPDAYYDNVIRAVKKNIKENDGHLDTGIFGTQFFFEVLTEHGMHSLAYAAMNKTDEPGYGRWLELGATTTWEKWDTDGSHNHPMFGGGLTWFYRCLAGMSADPGEPGYRHIIFKPQPAGDLTSAEYYNETVYGTAGISWEKSEEEFMMEIVVPVGSYATVYLPASTSQKIKENGSDILDNSYITKLKEEEGCQVFSVQSGTYQFVVK